jgi:hypothetical protein
MINEIPAAMKKDPTNKTRKLINLAGLINCNPNMAKTIT